MRRLLALLLVFALWGCDAGEDDQTGRTSPPSSQSPTVTGTPAPAAPDAELFYAPDFAMTSLTGETYQLSDLRGQWVLLNFWATWCVPCVEEMPVLAELSQRHQDDLLVLAVNMREDAAAVGPFVASLGITFPILMNPPDNVLLDYQVTALPQTVLIDPAGEIVWRQFGPVDLAAFGQTLAGLMTGAAAPHKRHAINTRRLFTPRNAAAPRSYTPLTPG